MSKTFFRYLFVDLVRIFVLTAGTLAGIMSFAGLLRPLTEQGLDIGQVGKMLTFLTPAMMTYSLPVAALFATTVVYGRLAADNELTACRASGISYWVIGFPALVLGLGVALLSLLLLCFLVPYFSLKVEQVIYSNLAQVVVNHIEKNHQLRFIGSSMPTVFAQGARQIPPDPAAPDDQLVELIGPMIVSTDPGKAPDLRVPREFNCAETAVIRIHPVANDPDEDAGGEGAQVSIRLTGGTRFPRDFSEGVQGGIDTTTFGPMPFPSPIRENVKFMDVWSLARLAADPSSSQRVARLLSEMIQLDEERAFLQQLSTDTQGYGTYYLPTGGLPGEQYIISTDNPAPPKFSGQGQTLIFSSDGDTPQVNLSIVDGETTVLTAQACEARIRARPDEVDSSNPQMVVTIELLSSADGKQHVSVSAPGAEPTEQEKWMTTLDVPMSAAVQSVRGKKTLSEYVKTHALDSAAANQLNREQVVVDNSVRSELHSRVSFALSCPILVLMGCALGMMFKSGNFLTAFAVSFLPALLCITLNVGGQQTAEHIPAIVGSHFLQDNRPLRLGLGLIWGGNAVVLALAVGLIGKLTRR